MLIQSFISDNEIKIISNFISQINCEKLPCVGKKAFYYQLRSCVNVPSVINDIRKRCLDLIGMKCYQDRFLTDIVFVIDNNGHVESHTDPTISNCKHIRCNILIKKPLNGGILIDGDKAINWDVGDLYILDTSTEHNITKTIDGDLYGLSFGFQVPING